MSDVMQLPKYAIPGMEHLDPEVAALRLHNRKNRAVNPADEMEFPPYRFRPFPVAVYRDWDETARRRELYKRASAAGISLSDERQIQLIEDTMEEWETLLIGVHDFDERDDVMPQLREENERKLAWHLSHGWVAKPDDIRSAKDRLNKMVARAAAERAYDDRHLGPQAAAELEAIEDAADDHVVEVPEAPRRGPGRPRKVT